uniref:Uncharacterized protein n=1 Tax=Anguilla anguilla TaxID=7936 RepID=A0A0E9WKE2_ANGAN
MTTTTVTIYTNLRLIDAYCRRGFDRDFFFFPESGPLQDVQSVRV